MSINLILTCCLNVSEMNQLLTKLVYVSSNADFDKTLKKSWWLNIIHKSKYFSISKWRKHSCIPVVLIVSKCWLLSSKYFKHALQLPLYLALKLNYSMPYKNNWGKIHWLLMQPSSMSAIKHVNYTYCRQDCWSFASVIPS